MTTIYRVVVRGHFDDLQPDQRARLLAAAPDHDLFRSAFTADGTFTYDDRLVAFNLRYEVRVPDGDDAADPAARACDLATERATAWLDAAGIGHKHVRATAADMGDLWRG